jgi:hypothetical protein
MPGLGTNSTKAPGPLKPRGVLMFPAGGFEWTKEMSLAIFPGLVTAARRPSRRRFGFFLRARYASRRTTLLDECAIMVAWSAYRAYLEIGSTSGSE